MRNLKNWQQDLEVVVAQDQAYFEAHPEQEYYVRPITAAEISETFVKTCDLVSNDFSMFVGQIEEGCRYRVPITSNKEIDPLLKQLETMRKSLAGKTPKQYRGFGKKISNQSLSKLHSAKLSQ
jgi:hypothetical protein